MVRPSCPVAPTPSGRTSLLARIVPPAYLRDRKLLRELRKWLVLALVVRLILMPATCHVDLISSYHRSYELTRSFRFGALNPHEGVQALFLTAYSHVLPLNELLAYEGSSTATPEFWTDTFVRHPQVNLALFLFKVPYLLFDLAIAALFLHIFSETPANGVRAFAAWLLNPITVYTFYVFGRHEVVALFFVVGSLYLLQRRRVYSAFLALALAIWSRQYPILYLPFIFTVFDAPRRDKNRWLTSLFFIVIGLTLVATAVGRSGPAALLLAISKSRFAEFMLAASFQLTGPQQIHLFPLFWFLLLMLSHYRPLRRPFTYTFSVYCATTCLLYYGLALFHPQYFTWFIPFLVYVYASSGDRDLRSMFAVQIVLFFMSILYFWEDTTTLLFAPLAPDLFINMTSPTELLDRYYPWKQFLNIFRSFMSAACLFMAGYLLWGREGERPGGAQEGAL